MTGGALDPLIWQVRYLGESQNQRLRRTHVDHHLPSILSNTVSLTVSSASLLHSLPRARTSMTTIYST